MADTKTIKSKIKSIDNIRKITKAMEMVARSKMKRAIDRALGIRPYAFFALEFLVNFSYHSKAVSPFFKKPENADRYREKLRTLIVEIAANKGLCGGYNANMFREVRKFVANTESRENTSYIAVGKYSVQHVRILGTKPLYSFTNFSENITLAEVETLANIIKTEWQTGQYEKVIIAFTNFRSTLSQKPIIRQLLPLSADVLKNQIAEGGGEENWIDLPALQLQRNWSRFVIEPSEDAILDVIIPQLVTVQVYHAMLDALASEQASRMIAMKNATENANKLGDELLLSFNHIRQEGITRELSEIAAGAEALAE
jgi:F-type H+-transporting ATPase subunit gamma